MAIDTPVAPDDDGRQEFEELELFALRSENAQLRLQAELAVRDREQTLTALAHARSMNAAYLKALSLLGEAANGAAIEPSQS